MAKKKKKSAKVILDKARKARLREQMMNDNHYQRTKQQTHKSKRDYSRKNQKPPEDNDE